MRRTLGKAAPTLFIATVAITLAAILVGHSFSSDDVAQQAIAHAIAGGGPHGITTGSDSFVLKLPIYALINAIIRPGWAQLALESLLFTLGMIACWWLWCRRIINATSGIVFLTLAWTVSTGLGWLTQVINPNTRNIELGVTLLLSLPVVRWIEAGRLSRSKALAAAAGVAVAIGLLSFNDPYFLYIGVVPMLLAATFWCLKRRRFRPLATVYASALVGGGLYKLCKLVAQHHGFQVTQALPLTTVPASALAAKLGDTLQSFLMLLNGNLFGVSVARPGTVVAALNLGVIGLGIFGAVQLFKSRHKTLMDAWIIAVTLTTLLIFTLNPTTGVGGNRYLIVLVFLMPVFLAAGLRKLSRARQRAAVGFMIVAIAANLLQLTVSAYHNRSATPNQLSTQLNQALSSNHIHKAYAGYWGANITYYFSNYQNQVLPLGCVGGTVAESGYLTDVARFATPATRTAILVAPGLTDMAGCDTAATIKQFGKPAQTVAVSPGYALLIYNRDILRP